METVIIQGHKGSIQPDLWVSFWCKDKLEYSSVCNKLALRYGNYHDLSQVARKYKFKIKGSGYFPYFYTKKELYRFINFLNNYRFIKL